MAQARPPPLPVQEDLSSASLLVAKVGVVQLSPPPHHLDTRSSAEPSPHEVSLTSPGEFVLTPFGGPVPLSSIPVVLGDPPPVSRVVFALLCVTMCTAITSAVLGVACIAWLYTEGRHEEATAYLLIGSVADWGTMWAMRGWSRMAPLTWPIRLKAIPLLPLYEVMFLTHLVAAAGDAGEAEEGDENFEDECDDSTARKYNPHHLDIQRRVCTVLGCTRAVLYVVPVISLHVVSMARNGSTALLVIGLVLHSLYAVMIAGWLVRQSHEEPLDDVNWFGLPSFGHGPRTMCVIAAYCVVASAVPVMVT